MLPHYVLFEHRVDMKLIILTSVLDPQNVQVVKLLIVACISAEEALAIWVVSTKDYPAKVLPSTIGSPGCPLYTSSVLIRQ